MKRRWPSQEGRGLWLARTKITTRHSEACSSSPFFTNTSCTRVYLSSAQ